LRKSECGKESKWSAIRSRSATTGFLVHIKIDDLSGPEIRELLEEHLARMRRHSPPESVHALPIEQLRKPEITFWTVWDNRELLGCGALKELDAGRAKSNPCGPLRDT
jgi:hypothetical protein